MKVEDVLYFAPGIRFADVRLDGPELPDAIESRLVGFFIKPAEQCCDCDQPFAAGVLLVCCIDALARLVLGTDEVGIRFVSFSMQTFPAFSDARLALRFYKDFRNGLVHEARLKRGAQFSLAIAETVYEENEIIVINPRSLALELRAALSGWVNVLRGDSEKRKALASRLRGDFKVELA